MSPSLVIGIAAGVGLPILWLALAVVLPRVRRHRTDRAPLAPSDRRAVAEAERLRVEALASRMAATSSALRQR